MIALSFVSVTVLTAGCNDGIGVVLPPPPPRFEGTAASPEVLPSFIDATGESGITHRNTLTTPVSEEAEYDHRAFAGGLAVADMDGDGDLDFYAAASETSSGALYQNDGAGMFVDVTSQWGLPSTTETQSGATFADWDEDGDPDLIIGLIFEDTMVRLYRNDGGGFVDVTSGSGLDDAISEVSSSTTFGDYDRDGHLDLFITHWRHNSITNEMSPAEHLYRGDGTGQFTNVTESSGIGAILSENVDRSFGANFADINEDGWPDLLLASDFGTSRVLLAEGNGRFVDATGLNIAVDNAMGSSVGDFDNDGHLDWFVSAIFLPAPFDITGNALYRGRGDGTFDDVTTLAGVQDGGWGWGACFADFNLDGHLDIFHVNGWDRDDPARPWFDDDAARLFVSNGDGTFREAAVAAGIADRGLGTAMSCSDFDGDADVDVLIYNINGRTRLYRNELVAARHLRVALEDERQRALTGTRLTLQTSAGTQMRHTRIGTNYLGQDGGPEVFGLGAATPEALVVRWPDGEQITLTDLEPRMRITRPATP